MKRKIILIILIFIMSVSLGCKPPAPAAPPPLPGGKSFDFTLSQLAGKDTLGREFLPNRGFEQKKYVGLSYLTLGSELGAKSIHRTDELLEKYGELSDWVTTHGETPESIEEYYSQHPLFRRDNVTDENGDVIAPNSENYWIGEPIYGFYSQCDPWVLKRQLALFGYMDIDFLWIDFSNYEFYFLDATNALLTAIAEMKRDGYKVPDAAFMLPENAMYTEKMLGSVWNYYMKQSRYKDVWFLGDKTINPAQKPMIVGNFTSTDAEVWEKRVWLKQMQWPGQAHNEDAMPWIDWADKQQNHNGVMNVSVAQHVGMWSSQAYLNRNQGSGYHGRGWTYGDTTTGYDPVKVKSGANFEQQWDWAIDNDVYLITIREWNEWAARKLGTEEPGAETSKFAPLVDEFNDTYSRCIEMMDGGYGDNFVMQMARKIREFKGIGEGSYNNVADNAKTTLDINQLSSWDSVYNIYTDYTGVIQERTGIETDKTGVRYYDTTNRNDIGSIKMASDIAHLYVNVTCAEDIKPYVSGDSGWMNLYVSTGKTGGWENYNYLINATPNGGNTTVHALTANSEGKKVLGNTSTAAYVLSGKTISFKIALSDLGVSSGSVIQIKATDNVGGVGAFKVKGTADDFYITGDAAPYGRFNYTFKIA